MTHCIRTFDPRKVKDLCQFCRARRVRNPRKRYMDTRRFVEMHPGRATPITTARQCMETKVLKNTRGCGHASSDTVAT